MSAVIDRDIAKWNLAVNLWDKLLEIGNGYKWLADELTARTGEVVHVSRIQKILHQTSVPEWSFVLNIAEVFECSVDDLAEKPRKAAEKAYRERFPRFSTKVA
jgi:hypothetical protein